MVWCGGDLRAVTVTWAGPLGSGCPAPVPSGIWPAAAIEIGEGRLSLVLCVWGGGGGQSWWHSLGGGHMNV